MLDPFLIPRVPNGGAPAFEQLVLGFQGGGQADRLTRRRGSTGGDEHKGDYEQEKRKDGLHQLMSRCENA